MKTLSHPMFRDVRKRIALFKDSQSLPTCPSDKNSIEMQMSVEQWWNDSDRGKLKYWERNIIQRGW